MVTVPFTAVLPEGFVVEHVENDSRFDGVPYSSYRILAPVDYPTLWGNVDALGEVTVYADGVCYMHGVSGAGRERLAAMAETFAAVLAVYKTGPINRWFDGLVSTLAR